MIKDYELALKQANHVSYFEVFISDEELGKTKYMLGNNQINMIRLICTFILVFYLNTNAQIIKTFKLNGKDEISEIVKVEDFKLFDNWEIVDRQWFVDCSNPIKMNNKTNSTSYYTSNDLHLGEMVKFDTNSVYSNSNALNLNLPFTK